MQMDIGEREGLIQDYGVEIVDDSRSESKIRKSRFLLLLAMIIIFAIAFIGGFFLGKSVASVDKKSKKSENHSTIDFHQFIQKNMKASNIENNLRAFTRVQHIAGSEDSNTQTKTFIFSKWKDYLGADKVELKRYNVLLSYPSKSGIVSVIDGSTNKTISESHKNESRLWPDEDVKNVAVPFNAYSASGKVKGKLVYVNYATVSDFKKLEDYKVICKGKILIARYGKNFRGNKVSLAQASGAIGMIIYSDPANYASGDSTYPQSWWLPPDGVQRGTIYEDDGDPLTPGYPSTDGIFRILENETNLPTIPVQPISYEDALPLLRQLDGLEIPSSWKDWKGGLNITYRLTMSINNTNFVELNVNTKREKRDIYNVIATIKGSIEPDRLILVGNHHDAWVMGAADPSSGSAILMEIVRVVGEALNKGWKPHRTLVFCNWDAEEYGLIGSTEWVEDYLQMLKAKAVAYLNSDVAVNGNYSVTVKSSDQLANMVFDAANKVEDPDDSSRTVFTNWRRCFPDRKLPEYPRIRSPGSGSDYKTFYNRLGVPIVDISYTYNWDDFHHAASYPVYHSIHDSFHWMKTFVDPNFTHHLALGKVWARLATTLSDVSLLPFNFTRLAWKLDQCALGIESKYMQELKKHAVSLDVLKLQIKNFSIAVNDFHEGLKSLDQNNLLLLRMANDQMMQVERSFINPNGLPNRPFAKNVAFAPSQHDQYAGACFPGIADALYSVIKDKKEDWRPVREQVSVLAYHIKQAARSLSSRS